MSTRSVIARWTNKEAGEWAGTYHHWDGYPTGLGAHLFGLIRDKYKGDVNRALKELVDDHPAGWSTLMRSRIGKPECYCHPEGGGAEESETPMTQATASAVGCEWAYVLDPDARTMSVLGSYTGEWMVEQGKKAGVPDEEQVPTGTKMIGMFGMGDPSASWQVVAEVSLDGPEPDWQAIETAGLKRGLD
jgi:hypothetical protein